MTQKREGKGISKEKKLKTETAKVGNKEGKMKDTDRRGVSNSKEI
jgi:hypothetical protein